MKLDNFKPLEQPQSYSFGISIRGYETHLAIGDLPLDAYSYWIENDIEILLEPEEAEEYEVPDYANIFKGEYWNEIDHQIEESGFVLSESTSMIIRDADGKLVQSLELTKDSLDLAGLKYSDDEVFDVKSLAEGDAVYLIEQGGYGETFTGCIVTSKPFSINNLSFSIAKVNGVEFINQVFYEENRVNFDRDCDCIDVETSIDIFKG